MTDKDYKNSGVPEMARYEHRRKNVGAKAVVLYGYDANTDSYFPITAVDNGDGTYSIKTSGGSSGSSTTKDLDPGAGTDTQTVQGLSLKQFGGSTQATDDSAYGDGVTQGILSATARVWNGSSYDRLYGDATNGVWVNVKAGTITSAPAKASDAYGIQAISDDGTYKYFFFEDDSAKYYVMRKHKTNKTFSYTKGTGGYASVYVNSTSGPSGSPTWADRGPTF